MPNTLQEFLAHDTQKAADELIEAFLRLPEEKRAWRPDEKARTALDQVAECAILNGNTAELIQTRTWQPGRYEEFLRKKGEMTAQGWEPIHALLQENTRKVIAVIGAVADAELNEEVEMPWGKMRLSQILAYPDWNMTYHLGQINYIASILGCLP
ncbi:MAG TPA: DinB family protein [Chthonomonadaceae bacterium]|nr:DinB family protein [Chthonomonadaceae bacterium]